MSKISLFLIVGLVGVFGSVPAFAQQPQLATFQEQAQIVIDTQISHNATASITLLSTSNQEIQVPSSLEQKIIEDGRVIAVVITNEENCILGVFEKSCILINVERDADWKGIEGIQNNTKIIGNSLINDINQAFDTDAEFHSVFLHHRDETNVILDTSGVISGRGTVSAVYTMPMESTDSMYQKMSSLLLAKVIRESGGFYNTALELSNDKNAKMTFSIITQNSAALYQLKLSVDYPEIEEIGRVSPLSYLKTDELRRSDYFSGGFYPLNSLLQVVIISPDEEEIKSVNGKILPTQIIDEQKIPVDLTNNGWIFEPESGKMIEGKYLFGKSNGVSKNELVFTLSSYQESITEQEMQIDESIIVVTIIAIVAAGATAYYLKGYKKSS